MTDFTELAQSLKRRAASANEFGESLYVKADDVLALVEALEYYKSREERVTSLVRDNSKSWDELYRQVEAKGKRNVELVEALEKAQQYAKERDEENQDLMLTVGRLRVEREELESRTVKLPKLKMLEDYLAEVAIEERKQILVGVKLEFHRALTDAGIKMGAE
ncbi:hypothetical protein [Klebsiella pneumoniae]|jgi:hypothetical protein|uniref:hypothetical protein n=1 Tax=Klebsiella pneumoniae TaxID=573 RepID=UPI0035CD2D90